MEQPLSPLLGDWNRNCPEGTLQLFRVLWRRRGTDWQGLAEKMLSRNHMLFEHYQDTGKVPEIAYQSKINSKPNIKHKKCFQLLLLFVLKEMVFLNRSCM